MDKLHNGYLVFFGPLSLDLHYLLIGPMECGWIPPEDRIDRVILELPLRLNRHIQRIQPRHTRVQLRSEERRVGKACRGRWVPARYSGAWIETADRRSAR